MKIHPWREPASIDYGSNWLVRCTTLALLFCADPWAGLKLLMLKLFKRFLTVCAEIRRAAFGRFLAVKLAVWKRSLRWDVRMNWSSLAVETRGRPLRGSSDVEPVMANLLTVLRTVFLWIPNRWAMSLCFMPDVTIPIIIDLTGFLKLGMMRETVELL